MARRKMEALPLLELNVHHAINSVLDKPRWWGKLGDAALRAKWLDEIQEIFLRTTFSETLVGWEHGQWIYDDLRQILRPLDQAREDGEHGVLSDSVRGALESWLRSVVTDCAYDEEDDDDEEYSEIEGVDDEEEQEERDEEATNPPPAPLDLSSLSPEEREAAKAKLALARKRRAFESYAFLKWAVSQLSVYETLQAVPFQEWAYDRIRALSVSASFPSENAAIDARCTALLRRLLLDGMTTENLRAALPVPADAQVIDGDKLEAILWHCERIKKELTSVEAYITQWIGLTLTRLGLRAADEGEGFVISPSGVHGTYICDNAIPSPLREQFAVHVSTLENVPDEEKDWHPRSNRQVLDLVHPSLYCCVYGKTRKMTSSPRKVFKSPLEQMEAGLLAASEVVHGPDMALVEPTSFQWIPTEFKVEEDGSVRVLSYINNLHPETHSKLYDAIAAIVGHFVPMFENLEVEFPPSNFPQDMYSHDSWKELPQRPKVPTGATLPEPPSTTSLRSKTLQIIVKIAEIVLTPEKPKYAGGSWHVEGTGSERIVGTGLYYFGCDNITESRLAFRAEVDEPPYQQSDDAGVAAMYGLFNEDLLVQRLGSVTAMTGRCVVFPNCLQHQVQPFELADPTKPGTRKILALFLVDPEMRVLSTLDIPAQQREWQDTMLGPLLSDMKLVEESAEKLVREMLPPGMTREEANTHRLALMDERAAKEEDNEDYERYFSLCEH
jgi:hypothetical protein